MTNAVGNNRATLSRVVRHSSLVLMLQVVLLACAVSNNFLLAHIAGPAGRGQIYVLQLISNGIGLPVLHFCLGFAAIYFLGQDRGFSTPEIASGILLPSLAAGILPALGLAVAWPWLGARLTQSLPATYLWAAVLSIPFLVLTFNISQFSLGRHKIGQYNLLGVGPSALLAIFLLMLLAFHQRSVAWLVTAWVASVTLPAVYALRIISTETSVTLLPHSDFFRSAFQFGWRSHLGGVTQQLQHRAPVLLVGYFLPMSQLGIYSLAISLAELLWYVPNAISTVLMPHVASGTEEQASQGTPTFCRVVVSVTCILAIGLSLVAGIVIPWLLPAFRGSLLPFYILMPGVVMATVFKVLASDFNGRGRPLATFYPAFAALVFEVIAACVFIPRFGLTAAALVTTAGYGVNSLLYAYSYWKLTGIRLSELTLLRREDLARLRSAVSGLWTAFTVTGHLNEVTKRLQPAGGE